MKYEKSCGFVAYQETAGIRLFLLIRALNGEYGFPKGHVEQGETELETAVRELKEETNIAVRIIDGFRRQISYRFPSKENVIKQAVYFLGKCTADRIICQTSEVSEAIFLPLDQALALLSFEDTKSILREANAYLDTIAPG